MKELNFDIGLVTYSINGKCEISFNPTDSAFVERLYETFNMLDKKQDEYRERISSIEDDSKIFEVARALDREMRGLIDDALEAPICDSLFGSMNVYALADGLPIWCNLMLAILDVVDASFADEQKKTNPRVAKYAARYKKK